MMLDDRAVSTTDKVGTKSPQLAAGTLALFIPDGCRSVTVRADAVAAGGPPTVARYSTAVLAVGAQSASDGSKVFDLGGDVPIPCYGIATLYFAVDVGVANWQFVFEVGGKIPTH